MYIFMCAYVHVFYMQWVSLGSSLALHNCVRVWDPSKHMQIMTPRPVRVLHKASTRSIMDTSTSSSNTSQSITKCIYFYMH